LSRDTTDRRLQGKCKFFILRPPPRLSVSYPADRRLQAGKLGRRLALHRPFSILSCGSSVASQARHQRLCCPGQLSVSYPADRRLQDGGGDQRANRIPDFQYPILRIVGCKLFVVVPDLLDHLPFSILSCGSSVASDVEGGEGQGGYYAFSILSCGSSVARQNEDLQASLRNKAFSILSCGSSVARENQTGRRQMQQLFQYPILRIVGCKSFSKTVSSFSRSAFSILSCGSSVARDEAPPVDSQRWASFSILSCGSSVARVPSPA